MKISLPFILTLFTIPCSLFIFGQEIPLSTQQQLENQTDALQGETEDDTYLVELEQFRKNPLNLNTADADELKQLSMISDLQIANLLSYRNLFGRLISMYELQAVPSWDLVTIRKLIPYVTVAGPVLSGEEARKRFSKGEHSLLLRVSQVPEKSAGFDKTKPGTKYLGSRQKILFRYLYAYKNLLQFGLLGDKDAGEQFGKGAQKQGFDFYSIHFFARKMGIVQSLALGDFSVNMGQGLIQWQGLAFKKSMEAMGIKRQSAVLRPYRSAGEFYFHRGAGITLRKARPDDRAGRGALEATVFTSFRKLSANLVADTLNREDIISSFLTSGYHRTAGENGERNNLRQTAMGGNVIYRGSRWHAGINGIYYDFSLPLRKRDEPYNLYVIGGKNWYNFSVDYSYTRKNIHVFGEAAADKNFNRAFINGLLASVDRGVDISFVLRTISPAYQSVNANAFTENTYPTNETGFYAGITLRPATGWRIDAYGDIYKFPWLKYLVDAPSQGKDFLVQLTFSPGRHAEVYSRFRSETKQKNHSGIISGGMGGNSATHFLVAIPKQNWRTQVNCRLNPAFTLRNRVELLWYDHKKEDQANPERGFLSFFDLLYKPLLTPWSVVLRLQYFETDGYDSRIYAYENDVQYSYSIPASYDKGFRYYLDVQLDITRKISLWFRWASSVYQGKAAIGSGPDEITGKKKSEIKCQARWIF